MRAALGANISPSATMASSSRFRRRQRRPRNSAWLNPQQITSRAISRAAGRGWQGSAASSTLHCSTVAACLCRVTSFGGKIMPRAGFGPGGWWVRSMGWRQDLVDGRPVRGASAHHLVGEPARLVLVRQFRYGPKSHGLARPILIEGDVPDLAVDVNVSDWSLGLWGVRAGCQ